MNRKYDFLKTFSKRITENPIVVKTIFICLFICIVCCALIPYYYQSPSYESSIYSGLPIYFFFILFLVFFATIVLILQKNLPRSTFIYSIIVLFLIDSLILSLSIIKGYYAYGLFDDPAYHFGNIRNILDTGRISTTLFYPIIHIFGSIILLVTAEQVSELILIFISNVLFLSLSYIIAISLFNKSETKVYGVLIISTLACGVSLFFTPNAMLLWVYPILIFLILKLLNGSRFEIPLLIVGVLSPFIHPIASLIYVVAILSAALVYLAKNNKQFLLLNQFFGYSQAGDKSVKRVIIPMAIGIIFNVYWMINFYLGQLTIRGFYHSVIDQTTSRSSDALISSISYADKYNFNLIELLLKYYGNQMVFLLLFSIGLLLIYFLKLKFAKSEGIYLKYTFSIVLLIVIFAVALLVGRVPFSPLRLIHFTAIPITVFFLIVITNRYLINNTTTLTRFVKPVFMVMVGILFINTTLSLYPSVYLHQMNPQNSETDLYGFSFFQESRVLSIPLVGMTEAPGRLQEYYNTNRDLPEYLWGENEPPSHFGYNVGRELGSYYDSTNYLIITGRDIIRYTEIVPEMANEKQNKRDFDMLSSDKSINFIYSNGFFDQGLISPSNTH